MQTRTFKVGELRKVISESASEFKAKKGDGVERDNKKNNGESYKEAEKRAKDFDGGLKNDNSKRSLPKKTDNNRTLLDYNPRIEPDKEYKKRVEAELNGYSTALEAENGIEKTGDRSGNKAIAKQLKDASTQHRNDRENLDKSGLQAREMPDGTYKRNSLTEGKAPKAKLLRFKQTKFLNEAQVLSRIPEQYKIDGQVIHMCDRFDNVYIVECVKSKCTGNIETNIVAHKNKKLMNEQVNRINQLMDWNGSETNVSYDKGSENNEFQNIMDDLHKM